MAPIPLFLAAVLLLAAPLSPAMAPAMAQEPPPAREQIRLLLTAEDWVATETAEVELIAELTLVGQDPAAVRREVTDAFARIEDAPWRIVAFGRNADASGAERWTIRAEARLPQARLDGLHARARAAGTTGRAFRVGRVDTAPSLAEREAVLRSLRGRLYGMARDEIEVAKALWPGRAVRIARVEFGGAAEPGPRPFLARTAEVAQSMPAATADAVMTERKIVLSAWVTLVPAP